MSAGGQRQRTAPEPEKGRLARLGAAARPCGAGRIVKQFPTEDGRYVVLLFKATEWSGTLTSSEEGGMQWVEYSRIPSMKTVDDLEEMLHMMNTPELTEFQYLIRDGEWIVSIK